MNRNLIKALIAGGLAVLITMGTLNTSMAQSGASGRPIPPPVQPSLEGTWDVQVTIINCDTGQEIRSFASLVIFMAGGTMIESTSGTPPALKTPGAGVWYRTTDNNYVYSFKHFNFNAQNVFIGWQIIHAEAAVDPIGNSLTGSGTVEIYDANGVLMATGCTRLAAARFDF